MKTFSGEGRTFLHDVWLSCLDFPFRPIHDSLMTTYHVGNCPACRNGRLFLFRETDTGDVYGHCEECEQGFRSPDEIDANSGFLTLLNPSGAEWATAEDIGRSVWANYEIFPAQS
jgi:hypothetical protein